MFDPAFFDAAFFDVQSIEPAPPDEEPPNAPAEGGPWISEGTTHTGHRPNH